MIEIIWWVKTQAIFDVWSFEHILSGISIWFLVMSTNFKAFEKKIWFDANKITTRYFDLIGVLFIAFLWETIEHYLELGLLWSKVEYWFQWEEMWANRVISDPLMLVLWYFIARKWGAIVKPARFLSIIWLFVHVFVFPHSMYLHHYF